MKLSLCLRSCLLLISVLSFSLELFSDPFDFSYSGRLVESDGKPYEGPVALKLSFFHSDSAPTAILEVTNGLSSVALTNGVFQVKISLDPIDFQAVFPGIQQDVYVQVTDLTHQQTYSRQQVSMLPYAGKIPVSSSVLRFNDDGELALASDPESGKVLTGTAGGGVTWTTPASGVGAATSDTFTNKTIDASSNTITNISNSNIGTSAAIADTKLATISTAGKVSGSAITSGTIAGSTALSTSGEIATSSKMGVGTSVGTSQLEVKGGGTSSATSSLNVTDSAGASKLFVRDDGNVGVGTITPTGKLNVESNGNWGILVGQTSSASSGKRLAIGMDTTNDFATIYAASEGVAYLPLAMQRYGGNVGIGSTSPISRLSNSSTAVTDASGVSGTGSSLTWVSSSGGGYVAALSNTSSVAGRNGLLVKTSQNDSSTYIMKLESAGVNQVSVRADGNVGIGTSNPGARLDILGSVGDVLRIGPSSLGSVGATQLAFSKPNPVEYLTHLGTGGSAHANTLLRDRFFISQDNNNNNAGIVIHTSHASQPIVFAPQSSEVMRVNGGNVGIGTTSPSQKLHVNGMIRVDQLASSSATALCIDGSNTLSSCSSSIRYKTDVSKLNLGLNILMSMRPVHFKWKTSGEDDIGFIAEEVHALDPVLSLMKDGRVEGVRYSQLTALIVNAFQEFVGLVKNTLSSQKVEFSQALDERDHRISLLEKELVSLREDFQALKDSLKEQK